LFLKRDDRSIFVDVLSIVIRNIQRCQNQYGKRCVLIVKMMLAALNTDGH
jgi:hypothetical protein